MTAPEQDRQRDIALQRVRVGVTGLAAVFLLTLLAASLLAFLGQDRGAQPAQPPANAAVQEPLAELGVAPGNAPKPVAPAPHAPPQAPRH